MNRRFSALSMLVPAMSLLLAGVAHAEDTKNPTIAKVNGEAITAADMKREMEQLPPQLAQLPLQAIYPQLLEQMILERTVRQAGYAAGLKSDDAVTQRLKEAEGKIVADEYLRRDVKKRMTDDKLKAAYDDYKAKFKPEQEVRASHILVKTEAEATDLIKQIKGGADFAKLASEKSEDKAAAKQGGDLGWFRKSDMVEAFSKAAFDMKPGDVSAKPVKTEFGYHIIKLVDKRQSQPESFETVKPQLEAKMGQQLAQAAVKDLVGKAKIERFQPDGTPLPAKADAPAAPAAQ